MKNGKESKVGSAALKAQLGSTAAPSAAPPAADPAEPAEAPAESGAPAAAAAAEAPVVPPARPAARPALTGKKVLAPRKPAAKSGGLGVKKLATKVDDSLFDQKPAEPVAPVPVGAGSTASEGPYLACGPPSRHADGTDCRQLHAGTPVDPAVLHASTTSSAACLRSVKVSGAVHSFAHPDACT